ncbi:MAG: hypothetical protein GY832_07485 [Chloroflexi bacterium]|nr:hypothetical protein [Chloroflexota bacterium]
MEAYEYTFVRNQISNLTGIDLTGYPGLQVQRRLGTYLVQSGHANWPQFFRAISHDAAELNKFQDYLTSNVSSFFQNAQKFDRLQKIVLPELMHRRPKLYVWSIGCSHGHDLYSLAITLAEASGFYHQHYILATNTDRSAIEWTRAGGPYSTEEVAQIPFQLLNYYFVRNFTDNHNIGYYIIERLRRKIAFHHQDPLKTSFKDKFDLIACHNTETYESKDHLYICLRDALRPGGVLFVDDPLVASQASDLGFETTSTSFYRRK